MSTRLLSSGIASLIIAALVVPAVFFIAPPQAHAIPVTVVGDISFPSSVTTALKTTYTAIKDTLIEIHTYTSAAADVAQYINTYVLEPLAFVMSGQLIKMLTAAAIGFVIGEANGTGIPQFITDVHRSVRTVADGQALAYLKQIGQTNSPFATSIAASLNSDYLSKTSLAGFWKQNLCTLEAASPDVNAYLRGNWTQGGIGAWFTLTTQVQNDPYSLYLHTQEQLHNVVGPGVGGATGARISELNWGQGFMSWCGNALTEGSSCSDVNGREGTISSGGVCITSGAAAGTQSCSDKYGNFGTINSAGQCVADPSSIVEGFNPGDPCTQSDGTPGQIKTPGSTIKSTLDKVLGGQQDQIVRMGNIGPEINGILGDIGTVFNTINLASSLLGGHNSPGGLLGAGNISTGRTTSRITDLQTSTSTLGITTQQIYKDNKDSIVVNADTDMKTRVNLYKSAWTTIMSSANTASSSLTSLASFCTKAADDAARLQYQNNYGSTPTAADIAKETSPFITAARDQAKEAQKVISSVVAPVLAQAALVPDIIAAALAQDAIVQDELATGSTSYTTDAAKLRTMSPTSSEVGDAGFNATRLGAATAVPEGSLSIAASDSVPLADQMSLLSTNASGLKQTVCTQTANNNAP